MLSTLEPDGTLTTNLDEHATSFLPDGSGFRVRARFIQAGEGLITYNGLASTVASYTAVLARYPTYNDILIDSSLAVANDVDLACLVTGVRFGNGRTGLFNDIEAATCSVSITDRTGILDPRLVDTPLGPGRRVRSGTWLRIEVVPPQGAWRSMFTGLVSTWSRTITAGEVSSEVTIEASDFFEPLANANVSGAMIAQLPGARVTTVLQGRWSGAWGPTSIANGVESLDARTLDDVAVLAHIKAAAVLEDGRAFIAPDGTFTFQARTWRSARSSRVNLLGEGALEFTGAFVICTYGTIASTQGTYNALPVTFLTYDDMRICQAGAGVVPLPRVCTTSITAADTGDDVVNHVRLSYQPPNVTIVGYTTGTGVEAPVASTPAVDYEYQDNDSINRYGERVLERSDLQPLAPANLTTLAASLVSRWSRGDATVTAATVDFTAEPAAVPFMLPLFPGDLVNVVEVMPEIVAGATQFLVSVAEIASMQWNLTPETFDVQLTLDTI